MYLKKTDYDKKIKISKDLEVDCYSKERLEDLYVEDSYRIIGELSKKQNKKYINEIKIEENELYIYKRDYHNKLFYKNCGYISVGEDKFISIPKRRLLPFLMLFLISIIIGVLLIFSNNFKKDGPNIDSGSVSYDTNLKRPDDWVPTNIIIPGYDTLKITEGADQINVALWNPYDNPCYFQFNIIREDTGEEIFKTELIPPGQAVKKIPLENKFKAGEYALNFNINTFTLENHTEPLNGANVKVKLIVLNE